MHIAELFRSLQGEGLLTGTDSTFIRVSGCNLRCWFCDTPYASWYPEGQNLSLEEILAQVEAFDTSHVVITGGEPMIFRELVPLTAELRRQGRHITIETAGTATLPVACDLMSISPKLSNSTPRADHHPQWAARHERTRHAPEVIRHLTANYPYQLKFVVDVIEDCQEVEAYLREFPTIDRDRVLLMPQGIDLDELSKKAQWLEPYCAAHGLRYCPRRQIQWFGLMRGT
jgi:7-carboxy-7-deazaguanine synthase